MQVVIGKLVEALVELQGRYSLTSEHLRRGGVRRVGDD